MLFTRLLRVMKLTMLLILVASLAVHADGYPQLISLSRTKAPLQQVFNDIRKQTGCKFIYTLEDIQAAGTVNIQVRNATITQAMDLLLKDKSLVYKIIDKTIVVKKNEIVEAPRELNASPPIRVRGRVVNEAGEPVIASVLVKGTANGTSSNVDGFFELSSVDPNAILLITGAGIQSLEIELAGRISLNITVKIKVAEQEAVVVNAGYYSVTDREKTGSISKIKADVIGRQPVGNVLQAMQGRMPGIYINQITGVPGGNFTVRIRGTNSLANGNNPLYIIDGIPFISGTLSGSTAGDLYLGTGTSPLNSINLSDIESIEVLKDADATAIYGSRGANGVILITTKKGKSGAAKLNLDLKTGVSKVMHFVDLLNTEQYIAMRMQAVENDALYNNTDPNPGITEYDINGTWDQHRYTDWQKVLIGGTARMNDLNASVSGGSGDTRFLFSTGYNDQGTVFPGATKANRLSTHFSVTHSSANKKLDMKFSTSYIINASNLLAGDPTNISRRIAPNAPRLYDEDGKLNWENGTWNNPLAYLENRFKSSTYNLLTGIEFGYKFLHNFQAKINVGINDIRQEEKATSSSDSRNPLENATPALSILWFSNNTNRSITIEPQINWETIWGKGTLKALVGGTYQNRNGVTQQENFIGFPSNALLDNPAAAGTRSDFVYGYGEYLYAAVFGRINYNWDGKYIVNLTGRRDGSSHFGPGKRFANFGAAGLGWIFSKEHFLQQQSLLSFGKLRGSYGLTGNDQIGSYQYLDSYGVGNAYGTASSLIPLRLFNSNYSWEVNKKLETALELGFMQDRILLTTAWYRNRSSNQLISYKLASTAGFESILRNFPATVQNTGVELELRTENVRKRDITWTTSFNVTFPRNKLVAFPNLASSSYKDQYVVGQPLSIQKALHYLGVNPQTGKYEFEDANGDGVITLDDRQSWIVSGQQLYGGLNNSLTWKGLQVDIFLQFVRQHGRQVAAFSQPGDFFTAGIPSGNQPAEVYANSWKKAGDKAKYQYFSRSSDMRTLQGFYGASDAGTMMVNFMRLKNVSVAYSLPQKWVHKTMVRIYLQAQNLVTVTNYKGLDPETLGVPALGTLVAGIQCTL